LRIADLSIADCGLRIADLVTTKKKNDTKRLPFQQVTYQAGHHTEHSQQQAEQDGYILFVDAVQPFEQTHEHGVMALHLLIKAADMFCEHLDWYTSFFRSTNACR